MMGPFLRVKLISKNMRGKGITGSIEGNLNREGLSNMEEIFITSHNEDQWREPFIVVSRVQCPICNSEVVGRIKGRDIKRYPVTVVDNRWIISKRSKGAIWSPTPVVWYLPVRTATQLLHQMNTKPVESIDDLPVFKIKKVYKTFDIGRPVPMYDIERIE